MTLIPNPHRAASPWTVKERCLALFCGAFLVVQMAVPAIQWRGPRPARFGWQMWSVPVALPRFVTVMHDGSRHDADLVRYVGVGRGEMDLRDALPPHLCRVVPDIAAVEVRDPRGDTTRVIACR